MVPGFVQLGSIAVAAQLLIIAAFYRYLRSRQPLSDPKARRRTVTIVVVGSMLIAGGQLLALGSMASLRVRDWLTLQQALWLQEIGIIVTFVGYVGVAAAFIWHGREATRART